MRRYERAYRGEKVPDDAKETLCCHLFSKKVALAGLRRKDESGVSIFVLPSTVQRYRHSESNFYEDEWT
jgi:hypothetical protein